MADISAFFFILLIIGTAFPAMLTTWWLLFPSLISRAQIRVDKTPMHCFWLGLILIVALAIPILILLTLPFGPTKFIGWLLLGASLTVSSVGSAGIAAHIATRLSNHSNVTPLSGFIRSAVILELAIFFPVIGWLFVWIPIIISSFGATGFALLNWTPREKPVNTETSTQVNPQPVTRNL